ncbi:MAG: N-acetyltransferase family protein [Isosphaeraceae bacterium]
MSALSLPGFQIRRARPSDRTIVAEFNRRLALETESKRLDLAVLEAGVASALSDPDRLCYWLALVSDPPEVLGQAAISREWSDWRNGWIWWLQSVYVAEPYRGRGVFRALYRQIRDEARGQCDVIGLRLYVEDSNEPALRTYRALGLEPGGYSLYQELWKERFSREWKA